MKTLSNADLAQVTGGKTSNITDTANDGSGSGGNDQLLSRLQDIQSSIKSLSENQNKGLFGGANGLMFMTMALALSRRSEVYVYGGNSCRRGIYWRTSW
jgi:bacteriocin-like protein